ncbi:isocitrate lyase/phosphoenolpyruvate mutase family protein [Massilia sp. ST3]|uniref:isocitrate lyase/PEP mutase family protein n=1 Tax=Massilia sp. ST3 TaxID=2824903 RepID=UPI001B8283E3|nr:isocitrate lyase/phosphoenolpyruvate mutase family protein [Massilia sp. ST3]MBQ5949388.1 isocitrate lyase/phosphoenolpyruvate mutase family protein [Massilia sp. ST3]
MSTCPDRQFHALHQDGLLLLANCWDPGSARIAALAGAPALATSSAAVAWAHGYPDGSKLPSHLLVETAARIAANNALPLSVDMEDGYGDDLEQVARLAEELMVVGVVGINIEDGAGTPELLCEKIAAIRRIAQKRDISLFINARCDVYLRGLAPEGERVAMVLERAARYAEAGASGMFVPGLRDPGEIAAVVAGISLPLNVMALPGLPPVAQLRDLGVRRLSAGSAIAEGMFGYVKGFTEHFLATGGLDAPAASPARYGELNAWMESAAAAE